MKNIPGTNYPNPFFVIPNDPKNCIACGGFGIFKGDDCIICKGTGKIKKKKL